MRVIYDNHLHKETADLLEANGWKLQLVKDDESIKEYLDEDGLYGGCIALGAIKDFKHPRDGMFEIERILEVDLIGETDQDGCPIHTFFYQNMNWNGKRYEREDGEETDDYREMLYASGWDCAVIMWDVPATSRQCAIELKRMRNMYLNGKVHSN